MSRSGIVNVRMVITEEKIISNIDKVQKMINPNNKKQIVQLEEDTYFKDLIEYPNKKKFPVNVYNAAYGLVEFAINQFEENTKRVEELIRQREENIALAGILSDVFDAADEKQEDWKQQIEDVTNKFPEEIIAALNTVGKMKGKTSEKYTEASKLINAKINNLEANLHIEIDMERLEDSSKALSYIGIEISDALKLIPKPEDESEVVEEIQEAKAQKAEKKKEKANVQTIDMAPVEENSEEIDAELEQYQDATTFEAKPSLWQRFKNSKIVRAATFIFRIKVRIELPSNALPEGRGENN